jgi:hypothetical protein
LAEICVSMTVLVLITLVQVPVPDQAYRARATSCKPWKVGSGEAYVQSDSDDSRNLLPLPRKKNREFCERL